MPRIGPHYSVMLELQRIILIHLVLFSAVSFTGRSREKRNPVCFNRNDWLYSPIFREADPGILPHYRHDSSVRWQVDVSACMRGNLPLGPTRIIFPV